MLPHQPIYKIIYALVVVKLFFHFFLIFLNILQKIFCFFAGIYYIIYMQVMASWPKIINPTILVGIAKERKGGEVWTKKNIPA